MLKKALTTSLIVTLIFLLLACHNKETGTVFSLNAELKQVKQTLEVNGTSNLPNQAMILISWLDPQKEGLQNQNVIVQAFAFVADSKITAVLNPLKEVPAGKYLIRLRFSPKSYDPTGGSVHAAVGNNGEHLAGPQVVQDENVKMLENVLEINYQ